MIWLIYSLLSAFFTSLIDVFSKNSLKKFSEKSVAWYMIFIALPFFIPFVLWQGWPVLNLEFWKALLVSGTLNVLGVLAYVKALNSSDLSLSVPFGTFTPVFMLITSPIILGEYPGLLGIIGIVVIVIGSYILNLKEAEAGFFAPFRALLTEKGPRYMLVAAFCWSITSNFDKIGVNSTYPIFWSFALYAFVTIALLPFCWKEIKPVFSKFKNSVYAFLPLGLANALASIFLVLAYPMAFASFTIAIKRTNTLFTFFISHFYLKEKGFGERLAGTIIMILGVLLISFS